MNKKHIGFTLVEMAVVLAIISLIIVGISVGRGILENSRAGSIVTIAQDAGAAVRGFRERHKYFPGDLPNAGAAVPNLNATCDVAVGTASIGNGLIDTTTESGCAIDELFLAGLIKADADPANAGRFILSSVYGPVRIRSATTSAVTNFPPGTNVIEFDNLPCSVARQVDAKLDDGDIASTSSQNSKAKASVATCVEGGANDPVPTLAVSLN